MEYTYVEHVIYKIYGASYEKTRLILMLGSSVLIISPTFSMEKDAFEENDLP